MKNSMIPDPNEKQPRFAWRGMMLDCCRHFFGVEEIKKLISQLSLLKMNVFHWHLSNDQGFRIESRRFPRLNEISSFRKLDELDPLVTSGERRAGETYGGYYTQEEIGDVVAFAAERGVEVVPEIELPGHTTAILAAYPEFSCSQGPVEVAFTFGIHERILCAGEESVYSFLYELLDEAAALFPSRYFHIGGDEAPKSEWKKCGKCRALMAREGLKNCEQLQVYFTNRIIAHLKTLGKTAIVWNESVIEDGLDESAVVQYWMEMAPGPSYCEKEIAKGRKFIFSNQCQFYCDYSYAETPLRATLNFEPNVKGIAVPEENVLGIEAPLWTEWLTADEEIEHMLWPRLLAVAQNAWRGKCDEESFLKEVKAYLASPDSLLSPMPWEEATIGGDEALRAIARNMLSLSERHGKMAQKQGKQGASAVLPEDAPKEDPAVAVYRYMKAKMELAYSEEDVRKVLRYLGEARASSHSKEETR